MFETEIVKIPILKMNLTTRLKSIGRSAPRTRAEPSGIWFSKKYPKHSRRRARKGGHSESKCGTGTSNVRVDLQRATENHGRAIYPGTRLHRGDPDGYWATKARVVALVCASQKNCHLCVPTLSTEAFESRRGIFPLPVPSDDDRAVSRSPGRNGRRELGVPLVRVLRERERDDVPFIFYSTGFRTTNLDRTKATRHVHATKSAAKT